jgi:heavy metal sensor kinase
VRLSSVRMRLALWNVGVLALVLAAFGTALRYTNQVRLTHIVDEELAHRAGPLLGEPPPGGLMRPPEPGVGPSGERGWGPGERGRGGRGWGERRRGGGPPPGREPLGFQPRGFDLKGRSLRPDGRGPWDRAALARAARGQRVYSTTSGTDEAVRVLSVPVRQDGRVVWIVQFARPLSGVYEELGRLTRTQLTLIPGALLVAALGGAFLTERALRPVRQITQAAAQIGASDLSARLPVKGQDEFSELSCTFNGMLSRLEQAFGRLAQALDQQRRFTADASHELRTPLTIIKANTSLALEAERSNVDYRRALMAADRAADTTARIVRDLLLLARGDAGQLRLDLRPVQIGELLERAVEGFCSAEHAPIAVELPEPSIMVSGDPHHLLRLFSNLLENAVHHTPATGRVTLTVEIEESYVVVRVRDTGAGIAAEHLPHVCERFYRVDAARTRCEGGTGLGLAIVQSIVAAHQGCLTLESSLGEGTTVTVRLPGPIPLTAHGPASADGEFPERAGGTEASSAAIGTAVSSPEETRAPHKILTN